MPVLRNGVDMTTNELAYRDVERAISYLKQAQNRSRAYQIGSCIESLKILSKEIKLKIIQERIKSK